MGTKKDINERKNHFIGIRLTADEYRKILSDMERYGYLSVSKYVREKVIKGRLTIKEQIVTDKDIKDQVNKLTTEISRIGSNYNKTVRKYLAVTKIKKSDGSPAINTRSTNYYIDNLHKMTMEIKKMMDHIIETISDKED